MLLVAVTVVQTATDRSTRLEDHWDVSKSYGFDLKDMKPMKISYILHLHTLRKSMPPVIPDWRESHGNTHGRSMEKSHKAGMQKIFRIHTTAEPRRTERPVEATSHH